MSSENEDRSTWPRNGQVIRREELLRLIEENGGPAGLDLRGARLLNDGPTEDTISNAIDLSPEALAPLAHAWRQASGGSSPAWLNSSGGIELWDAQLALTYLGHARLPRASLSGANLRRAHLSDAELRGAYLQGANLQGAYLHGTQLQGANLENARLQAAELVATDFQDARLGGAKLQAAMILFANFQGAQFNFAQLGEVDMYVAESLDGAHWHGAVLDHTRIRRDTLGKAIGDEVKALKTRWPPTYHGAKEAYLLLKNNFNQIGRYEDASWAYVKEQQMEKMAYHWEWRSQGWRVWRAWGSFRRWLRNWAYELTTGYGERPWNAVVCGLGAIVAFAVGFWATAAIGSRGAAAFLDSLVYSISAFATFNLARGDLNPEGRGVEIFSSLEAILGIGVLALVVFTLGNRMSRG